jgi:hypothetical protein
MERELSQDGCQIKREKDIYHHGPKHILIICHLPNPSSFSLPTTFKQKSRKDLRRTVFINVVCNSIFCLWLDKKETSLTRYTVKKRLAVFPSLADLSLTKLSLVGNNLINPGQGLFGKRHPGQGRENRLLFLQCRENRIAIYPRFS